MGNSFFDSRFVCPACSLDNQGMIFEVSYNELSIQEYLKNFYSIQATVELELVKDEKYILMECRNCGLIFQKNIPNAFFMKRIYEHWLDPPKTLFNLTRNDEFSTLVNYAQEIMQILSYLNRTPSSLNFLDFGMGWGKWALMAKAFGCESYGSELSITKIEHAKSKGIKIISWEEIPTVQYDFINTEQVFEHIPNPLCVLSYLANALKPDGLIKINVPIAHNIKRRLKKEDWSAPKGSRYSLNPVAPLEHINLFRKKSILEMAGLTGLIEAKLPMKKQYQYLTGWSGLIKVLKNIASPIRRNFGINTNYCLLKKHPIAPINERLMKSYLEA